MVDALALEDDEGRGKLRYASGRCKQSLIRRSPNEETQNGKPLLSYNEYIVIWGQPSELKHLSNWRKRKKNRLP